MRRSLTFAKGLALTILITAAGCTLFAALMPPVRAHTSFLVIAVSAMTAFCISLYRIASAAAGHKRAQLFIAIVMLGVFAKMILCLALIVGYKKLYAPADSTFLWPFLVIYVTFTIFEVIFMDRLARQKPTAA
jgi:hypothetical protein